MKARYQSPNHNKKAQLAASALGGSVIFWSGKSAKEAEVCVLPQCFKSTGGLNDPVAHQTALPAFTF